MQSTLKRQLVALEGVSPVLREESKPKILVACAESVSILLFDPMDCSPPGSTVHGILQARILEWVATSSSRGSS